MKTHNLPSKRHLNLVKSAGQLTLPFNESTDLGFMSRLLVMVNLPYRDPGDMKVWIRKNGNTSFMVTPAYDEDGKCLGLPYGSYPRIILAYLVTQAVQTKSPKILLGKSFFKFIRNLGLIGGGKQYKQVKEQFIRTIRSSFSISSRLISFSPLFLNSSHLVEANK